MFVLCLCYKCWHCSFLCVCLNVLCIYVYGWRVCLFSSVFVCVLSFVFTCVVRFYWLVVVYCCIWFCAFVFIVLFPSLFVFCNHLLLDMLLFVLCLCLLLCVCWLILIVCYDVCLYDIVVDNDVCVLCVCLFFVVICVFFCVHTFAFGMLCM